MLTLIHMPRPRRRHNFGRVVAALLAIAAAIAVGVSVAWGDCPKDCKDAYRECMALYRDTAHCDKEYDQCIARCRR